MTIQSTTTTARQAMAAHFSSSVKSGALAGPKVIAHGQANTRSEFPTEEAFDLGSNQSDATGSTTRTEARTRPLAFICST